MVTDEDVLYYACPTDDDGVEEYNKHMQFFADETWSSISNTQLHTIDVQLNCICIKCIKLEVKNSFIDCNQITRI